MRISIIVAAAKNGVIGHAGEIPWKLPDDQRFFRDQTTGHAIVLGRKTFDSIGRPLPGRDNLVLSRSEQAPIAGIHFFRDLDGALEWGRQKPLEECFIAGGEAIYRDALPITDRILLTRIEAEPEGDTFFPDPDESIWVCSDRVPHPIDERHAYAFAIETWIRRESTA